MKTNRIFEAMAGDEQSKLELHKAGRKAFRLGLTIFIPLSISVFLLACWCGPSDSKWLFAFAVAILPPLVFSSMVASYAFTFFTRHLKITLPESVAPRVEMREQCAKK